MGQFFYCNARFDNHFISDSFGYLGSVVVLLAKSFFGIQLSWTSFFVHLVLIISLFGIAATLAAAIYFKRKYEVVKPKTLPEYAA